MFIFTIIKFIFVLFFLIFTHIFIEISILNLYKFKKPNQFKLIIINIIFFSLIIFVTFLFKFINKYLFGLCYAILGTYFGIYVYCLFFTILNYILSKFFKIKKFISKLLIFIFPLLIIIFASYYNTIIHLKEVIYYYPNLKENITIALLTDLHIGAIYKTGEINRILNKIKETKVDIIVITGDIVDSSDKIFSEYFSPFNKLNIPILYITGNHEQYYGKSEAIKELNKNNLIHLDGKNYLFKNSVNFIGADYEHFNVIDYVKKINNNTDINIPNILLYHVPNVKPKDLKEANIFLMLSGHTHGGQVFPFHFFSNLRVKCFVGNYKYNDNNFVYVSPGIGTTFMPLRLLSKSSIILVKIQKK